jgi:hypothetical protein
MGNFRAQRSRNPEIMAKRNLHVRFLLQNTNDGSSVQRTFFALVSLRPMRLHMTFLFVLYFLIAFADMLSLFVFQLRLRRCA